MNRIRKDVAGKIKSAPEVRFEEQSLTSHAGLVAFQLLFSRLGLKERLRGCFRHNPGRRAYAPHAVTLLLVAHLILGCRELRDMGRYRNDEAVRRAVGLRALPDVSTVSRALSDVDAQGADRVRALSRDMALDRLRALRPRLATVDFDGTVLPTRRLAEGSAVGCNPGRKGERSYWPLFATVAQTGQVLDLLHRPGNVADSTGALDFIGEQMERLREALPGARLETRMDSAFFNEPLLEELERRGVDYSASVPFARFPDLKAMVEGRRLWHCAGPDLACFEPRWKPASRGRRRRVLVLRRRVPERRKEPLQLDLFEPREHGFEYKVVVTNKRVRARSVARFHEGRGAQEAMFAELKSQCGLGYAPSRKEAANRLFSLAAVLAHNLGRALQMVARAPSRRATAKRAPLWAFAQLRTMRNDFLLRAGRFLSHSGKPVLSIMNDDKAEAALADYLAALAT